MVNSRPRLHLLNIGKQGMKNVPLIVGLGETLWDIFPDGTRLGGAPLNFCCSAAELAQADARVLIASAIGSDKLGEQAINSLTSHGVGAGAMQTNARETGQVLVELNSAGVANYRFADNAAWDHLTWNDSLQQIVSDCDAVCFGTLGQRNATSRQTIQAFIAQTSANTLRILDLNLRAPFFSEKVIAESLALANALKLNDEELPVVAKLCGVTGSDIQIMQRLAEQLQFSCVALTRGEGGAILVRGDTISDLPGIPVDVVDTVGAGDAFTAAMTLGLLSGHDTDEINHHAIATASFACSQPGATMSFPDRLLAGSRRSK